MSRLYRTLQLASDAHGLVVLATLDPEQASYNPFAQNGLLISPDIALWILKTFQYPYAHCSDFSVATHSCDS